MMRSMRALALVLSVVSTPVLLGAGSDGTGVKSSTKTKAKSEDGAAGGLTGDEIAAVIRANLNQIRHCYETLLKIEPEASGKVMSSFIVKAKDGSVGKVDLTSNSVSEDKAFGDCITDKVKGWRFPKPRGGQDVTVNYPFVFNPL